MLKKNSPVATTGMNQEEIMKQTVMNAFAANFSKLEKEKRQTAQTFDQTMAEMEVAI